MARPRKGVTLDNSTLVFCFFSNMLDDYNKHHLLNNADNAYEAREQLNTIPYVEYCDVENYHKSIDNNDELSIKRNMSGNGTYEPIKLDKWVIEHITPKGWQQCLNNIRQAKYADQNKYKKSQIKIDSTTLSNLKRLANEDKDSKSLDEYLKKLIDKIKEFYYLADEKGINTLDFLDQIYEKENKKSKR